MVAQASLGVTTARNTGPHSIANRNPTISIKIAPEIRMGNTSLQCPSHLSLNAPRGCGGIFHIAHTSKAVLARIVLGCMERRVVIHPAR